MKIGRLSIDINENDKIFFNGAAYVLTTRKTTKGYSSYSPTVSKTQINKLLKNNVLYLVKEKLDYVTQDGKEMWNRIYKFDMEKIKEIDSVEI